MRVHHRWLALSVPRPGAAAAAVAEAGAPPLVHEAQEQVDARDARRDGRVRRIEVRERALRGAVRRDDPHAALERVAQQQRVACNRAQSWGCKSSTHARKRTLRIPPCKTM
jgi:hypothetical protein